MTESNLFNFWRTAVWGLLGWSLALYCGADTAVATGVMQTPPDKCPALVSVHCGSGPSGAFDENGRYWVIFVQQEHLYLSYSDNEGDTFSTPVKINLHPEPIYADGENRPKLALGENNAIYVSWTKRTSERFDGDIRFSRSLDRGKSFSPAQTVNDDGLVTSHRFDSLLVDRHGDIYLAWLDKRDRVAALTKEAPYTGAALYYAVSTDQGISFSSNQKVADHSCECCRIAISKADNGGAAVFWRHIFETNTRDHAFALLGPKGVLQAAQRATRDNWQIDACPHHGPAMTDALNRHYAMAWFSNGPEHKGIYFGLYEADRAVMRQVTSLTNSAGASHPQLLQLNEQLIFAAWKVFDGQKTLLMLAVSADRGKNWLPAETIAETDGGSDHPLLVRKKNKAYLSWRTTTEGLRLIPLLISQQAPQG